MNQTTPTVGLSLTVKDGAAALDFYTRAFGAKEVYRIAMPDGGIAHSEFTLGNSRIMMSEAADDWHAYPMPEGTMASCLFIIDVENCDAAFERAVAAGCTPLMQPTDQFWGARDGLVRDPFGYRWNLAQRIEDVSPEEILKRVERMMSGQAPM